ncbi:MAG: virulence RhuM family protein [Gemella haemolysans]|uniref:virulence RhuM family protein n=1 Tax=Gemella haemolysans TaxID=1379 RepID=UPI003F9FDB0C
MYKMEIVQKEGGREVDFYNLDVIISVGYRINSKKATAFRIWVTKVLKEYMIKGFAMDDVRLKQGTSLFGNDYFKELLERIRDIRSSEKIFYRQVLDLFATSIDYDGNSEEAKKFFSTVQNKMHYAIHQKTASELIFARVDGDKEFMGLTTFKGELPTLTEAKTAKNYLSEKELRGLNQLVSGYLDFAERQAEREIAMTMVDWIKHVDSILQATGEDVLENVGKVSYKQMEKKVLEEYKKHSAQTLTPVEKEYLKEIKNITKIAKEGNN